MSRWLAYAGAPVLLRDALLSPAHSLIDQGLRSRPEADGRRRLRHRLVRGRARRRRCSARSSRRANDANLRELAGHVTSPLFFAHIRASSGTAVQQDELPPVPARPLAVDAQRPDQRLQRDQARRRARRRPLALPLHRGPDGLRGALLPRADPRARGRPAGGGGRRHRARGGGRAPPGRRAPVPGHDRDDRRRALLGVPVLERRALAIAAPDHGRADAARPLPGARAAGAAVGGHAPGRLRAAGRPPRRLERAARAQLRGHRRRSGRHPAVQAAAQPARAQRPVHVAGSWPS